MIVRIYLIVEEGADRVYVQTSFPAWYVKPEGKRSEIYAVDVELPALRLADQYGSATVVATTGVKGLEVCGRCGRKRPEHNVNLTCALGGYCIWGTLSKT